MLPKRLSKNVKKQLLIDCIKSGCVTNIAKKHNVTRKTVYKHLEKLIKAAENTSSKKDDKVLFYIPVTKSWVAMVTVLLFIVCKSSNRDTVTFMKYACDVDISVGSVTNSLEKASVKAKAANHSYDLSSCINSATDELFHQGSPVLAAIDLDSKFCMELQLAESRDHNTWGYHLLNMNERGYYPVNNVMDGGSGMEKAFAEALPSTNIRYDHFHIIKSIKDTSRFLKNQYETSVTQCIKASTKMDKAKKQKAHQKENYNLSQARKVMDNAEYVYQQFKTLTNWLQYDILQLQSISIEDREELFDFIVSELDELAKRHPHRIKAIVTTLKNNKDKLINVIYELNEAFLSIAEKHNISIEDVWAICNNARYNLDGSRYNINIIKFYEKHGDAFESIEDDVLEAISKVHRSSSLIENLNSRLRPYLDPRKGFKNERFELIKFALNHIPFMRSANDEMKGKSPAEVFSQKDNIDFISLLGFEQFRKVA